MSPKKYRVWSGPENEEADRARVLQGKCYGIPDGGFLTDFFPEYPDRQRIALVFEENTAEDVDASPHLSDEEKAELLGFYNSGELMLPHDWTHEPPPPADPE